MGPGRPLSGFVVLLALVATTSRAHAQGATTHGPSTSEQLLAESLFEQGRVLMDQGRFPEACAKLAESQRLDPGGGTLLNLAVCHEKEGKLGTAYVELSAALAQATKEARRDRAELARSHLQAIAPRLPRLGVHVVQDEADLEVTIDGTVVRRPAWGVATVVDPGLHVVEASAPGKAKFTVQISVAEGEKRTVDVPPLGEAEAVSGGVVGTPTPRAAAPSPTPSAARTSAAFAAGLGFVVAGLSASIWLPFTITRRTQCDDARRYCSDSGMTSLELERVTFWVAVGGAAVGAAGLITFLALPSGTRVGATPTAGGGTVSLTRAF